MCCAVGPVVQKEFTLLFIVVLTLVASRAKGNSLDEGTSGEKVKDTPDELARERLVTREDFALGMRQGISLLRYLCVGEVEEVDITQVQVGEVSKNSISELRSSIDKGALGRSSHRLSPSRGNIALIRSYPMFQISDGSSEK